MTTPSTTFVNATTVTSATWFNDVDARIYDDVKNVMSFGAVGDGVTDDTAAIDAAYTAMADNGGILFFPAGTYLVTSLTPWVKPGIYHGAGPGATTIKTSSATADVVTCSTSKAIIRDIAFDASVTRTAGSYINNTGSHVDITHFKMTGYYKGISSTGGLVNICNFYMLNGSSTANGGGIQINGGADVAIRSGVMDASALAMPTFGINITQVADVVMHDLNIIHHTNDLVINPGTGDVVASVWASDCFFDTATRGILIQPSGTGAVVRCRFSNCWMGSHANQGVYMLGGGSTVVDGMDFVNCHVFLNGGSGIVVDTGCLNVNVLGGQYAANTSAGILFQGSVTDFSVVGAVCGTTAALGGNGTYGINISTTGSDRFRIVGNDLNGNTAGSLNNSSTGVNHTIVGNLPIQSTGWAAATGTADRTTFAQGSVSVAELAKRVKALIDDLTTQGVIGA